MTQSPIDKLRMLVEGHLHCGDQYPEEGWPDIHEALTILDTMQAGVISCGKCGYCMHPTTTICPECSTDTMQAAPVLSSELSVFDEGETAEEIYARLSKSAKIIGYELRKPEPIADTTSLLAELLILIMASKTVGATERDLAERVIYAIRPYLRTTEPVSVEPDGIPITVTFTSNASSLEGQLCRMTSQPRQITEEEAVEVMEALKEARIWMTHSIALVHESDRENLINSLRNIDRALKQHCKDNNVTI